MTPRNPLIPPAAPTVGTAAVLSLLLVGMGFATSEAAEAPPESIAWRSEYDSAFLEAKTAGRLLWVQFTGPWCPNCKRMERDSFPQPRIVEQVRESLIPVKLRSDENEDLAVRFGLTGLPATVLVDPESQRIIALHQGYLGPDELSGVFRTAADQRESSRFAADVQLASSPNPTGDRSNSTVRAAFSQIQEPRVQATLGIPRLPLALLSSMLKSRAIARIAKLGAGRFQPEPAFAGFCPVSLVAEHRIVPGSSAHSIEHEGRVYQFATAALRDRFRENPGRYLPVNRGLCPVSGVERNKSIAGDPHYGVLYGERLYLCASQPDRDRFLQDPARYAVAFIEERGNCPHCAQSGGVLVQGNPEFNLIRSGREYWFPDDLHRTAFLETLPSREATTRK